MKKDNKVRMAYAGYQWKAPDDLECIVSINRDTYHSLRYLLSFAAEKHEYFAQIEDAIHLHDSLTEAWNTAEEESEISDFDV